MSPLRCSSVPWLTTKQRFGLTGPDTPLVHTGRRSGIRPIPLHYRVYDRVVDICVRGTADARLQLHVGLSASSPERVPGSAAHRAQGLGEEHLKVTVKQLAIKGSGWDVVSGKRSWRKRKLAERPHMQTPGTSLPSQDSPTHCTTGA